MSTAAAADLAARQAATQLAGELVLTAGAGTGKTHTLVEVFVHLVAGASALGRRVAPRRILALTFSNKAAAELRERVRARFVALEQDPAARAALEAACVAQRVQPPTPLELAAWADAAAAAPIETFHAFAADLVRRHAALAGVDPRFVLLADDEARGLARQAAEAVVLARLEEPAVRDLVAELDLGGRGRAGLVDGLLELARRLGEEGRVPADLATGLDDGDAARAAFAEAKTAWRTAYVALIAATEQAVAEANPKTAAAIRGQLEALRAGEAFRLAMIDALPDDADPRREPAFTDVKREANLTVGPKGETKAARKAAREVLEAAFEALCTAHATARAARLLPALPPLLADAEARYRADKLGRGALDFADLLRLGHDLLAAEPAVRAEVQERVEAILVDEFQDTSPLQKQLLDLVRGPDVPRLVVGDPKQSIYEFRGADVTVFDAVQDEVRARGGAVLALTVSRRGRAPLVDAVNRLFARILDGSRGPFDVRFDPARDALLAHRETAPTGRADVDAAPVWLLDAEPSDEAMQVAACVRELVRGEKGVVFRPATDAPGGPPVAHAARHRDVTILLRRFTHVDALLAALRAEGIPHHVVGGRGFFEAQEIRDLGHALRLLDEPHDALASLGVLRSPLVGLSDASLLHLAGALPPRSSGRPTPLSLGAVLALAAPGELGRALPDAIPVDEAERLTRYLALHQRLAPEADRLGAAGVLAAIVEATDLAAVLAASPHGEQRVANLERLLDELAARDAGASRGELGRWLGEKLAEVGSLDAPAQILGETDDVVRVMTIHQAKGLEFPIVIVPDCGNALARSSTSALAYDRDVGLGLAVRGDSGERTPSANTRAVRARRLLREAAESLRLFYVACTRARDLLVLAGSATRGTSWRRLVDATRAEDPAFAARLTQLDPFAPQVAPTALPLIEREPALATPPAPPAPDARFAPPAHGAATLIAPVTELADLAACARRFHWKHEVGLAEHEGPRAAAAAPADPAEAETEPGASGGTLGAQARGTLAHRLLERLDLAAFAAHGARALDALLAEEGFPELDAELARVRAAVLGFLASADGQALIARPAQAVLREASLVFAPRGPAGAPRLLVKGQLDVALVDDDAVTIWDYKLARPGQSAAYAFQLAAYAAAARALWGRPVRAGLVFLLEPKPRARLRSFDDAELDEVEARLVALASGLAEARRLGRFPGVAEPACRAIGCGYLHRCHGGAPGAASAPRGKGQLPLAW